MTKCSFIISRQIVLTRVLWVAASFPLLASLYYLLSSLVGSARGGVAAGDSFALIRLIKDALPFSDFLWVAVVAACGTKNAYLLNWSATVCAPYGYGQLGGGYADTGYPPIVNALLRFIDFQVGYTGIASLLLGVLFVCSLLLSSWWLFRSALPRALCTSIILLSFPVQLVLERGNLDIFVFLLVAGTALIISLEQNFMLVILGVLTFLAVAIKAYPVMGFWGWLAFTWLAPINQYAVKAPVRFTVLAGTVVALVYSSSWLKTGSQIIIDGGMNSFGFKALGYTNAYLIGLMGMDHARLVIRALMLAKPLTMLVAVLLSGRSSLPRKVFNFLASGENEFGFRYKITFFLLMSCTWIGCYLITVSYDYKHIFLLPSLLVFFAMLERYRLLSGLQIAVLCSVVASGLFIVLLPILVYAPVFSSETLIKFTELFGEVLVIPFYAGFLAAVLGFTMIDKAQIRNIKNIFS